MKTIEVCRDGNHYAMSTSPTVIAELKRHGSVRVEHSTKANTIPVVTGVNGVCRFHEVSKSDLDPELVKRHGEDFAVFTFILSFLKGWDEIFAGNLE